MPINEESGVRQGGGREPNPAALFAIVWETLAAMLGTAAAAAIVRRAAGRAGTQRPELIDLVVRREQLEYHYTLPDAWSQPAEAATACERAPLALRALVAEIGQLLVELTGTIVVGRLEEIPELRGRGLVWRSEGAN